MALLISDANIFIDFDVAGLLESIFKLSEQIAAPDMLFEDELRDQHGHLLKYGLKLLELRALAKKYRHPSRLDLAALALAEQERSPLLTGDRHLRDAAKAEGVEVKGTLWLGERLVKEGLLTVDALEQGYARMKAGGRRLPWSEADQQVQRLAGANVSTP